MPYASGKSPMLLRVKYKDYRFVCISVNLQIAIEPIRLISHICEMYSKKDTYVSFDEYNINSYDYHIILTGKLLTYVSFEEVNINI